MKLAKQGQIFKLFRATKRQEDLKRNKYKDRKMLSPTMNNN